MVLAFNNSNENNDILKLVPIAPEVDANIIVLNILY